MLYAVLGLLALLLLPSGLQIIFLSSLALVLGLHVFYWHGGALISAAGVYSLVSAVMVGFGGIWWTLVERQFTDHLALGVTVGYFVHVAMFTFFWRQHLFELHPPEVSVEVSRWTLVAGLLMAPVGVLIAWSGAPLGSAIGLGALSILLLGITWTTKRYSLFFRVPVVMIPVLTFSVFVFSGYGRMQIAVFALFAAITFYTVHGRRIKLGIVISIPFALAQFAVMRERFGEEQFGNELDGIGSVVNPVQVFGRLVQLKELGQYEHGDGQPIWATLFFWVPREFWADKPLGFGSAIAHILNPILASTGHSEAALAFGEWYYNLGFLGIVLMVPVIGILIRAVDSAWFKANSSEIETAADAFKYIVLAVIVSSVAYYVWSSSHSFATRVVPQLIVVTATMCIMPLVLKRPAR